MAIVSVMLPSVMVFADTVIAPADCPTASNHRVFAQDDVTINGCIPNSSWDASIAASQLQNGQVLAAVPAGSSVTDDHGIAYTCSTQWSCVDTIHTDSYRSVLLSIAIQLKGLVLSTHRFDSWIASVK